MQGIGRQAHAGMFRPLDQNCAFIQCLFESEFFHVRDIVDAIKIIVAHREPRCFISLDQRKSRTRHSLRHAERAQNRARQRGFSRTKIALQRDRVAHIQGCGNPRAQSIGRCKVGERKALLKPLRILVHANSSSPPRRTSQRR